MDEYVLALRRLGELGRALAVLARSVGSADGTVTGPDGVPLSPAESKILRSFVEDGTEKEVNQLLALRHPDVASLRRYRVDHGFMSREGGRYRLRPTEDWPAVSA